MSMLRLGVIGAGSWTIASHLPNLARRRDEVTFTGVCRKGPELLESIRREWGFAEASEDYRDIVRAGMDICVVASPSALHREHAVAALEAGAHVLVEKPFTVEPADAWAIVDAARRARRHVIVAFGWHYRPMVCRAKELAESPGVGRVEHVMVQMASTTRELLTGTGAYPDAAPGSVPESPTWTDPALSGGGYGQAQLSHGLGLALWLTGLRGRDAFAMTWTPDGGRVELHDSISVRYEGGALGSVSGASGHLGAYGDRHQLQVWVVGSEGQLQLDVGQDRLYLYRPPGGELIPALGPDAGAYDCAGPVDALVDLALGRPAVNRSPGELGARTVEILDAAYRSARSGRLERRE